MERWTLFIYLITKYHIGKGKEDDDERKKYGCDRSIYKSQQDIELDPRFIRCKSQVTRIHCLIPVLVCLNQKCVLQVEYYQWYQSDDLSSNSSPTINHRIRDEESGFHWNGNPKSFWNPGKQYKFVSITVIWTGKSLTMHNSFVIKKKAMALKFRQDVVDSWRFRS